MFGQKLKSLLSRALTIVMMVSLLPTGTTFTVSASESMPTVPHPNAIVYQAENAQLSGTARVATDHTGYTGTGFVGGYDNSSNAATTFSVNVPSSGDYFISLRYSAGEVGGWPTNRTVGLIINGGDTESITLTGTGTWNDWSENIQKINLNAGPNIIRYTALTSNDNSDSINLDKLSVWAYSENPTIDALLFNPDSYTVSEGNTVQTQIYAVDSNGVQVEDSLSITYSSSDESIATVNEEGVVTGIKAGTAVITARSGDISGTANITVSANPTVTVDFAWETRPVDPSLFGYILTPNYDVPDSRMTLLGSLLNRETVPAQNFQAIGDMDGSYYAYEDSILQRSLESYIRAKDVGYKWYFLLGHNPSWATASGNPTDTNRVKTPEQLARFKQYIKDVLQYYKDNGAKPDFANLTNEYWTGKEPTYKAVWEALREVYPDPIPAVGPSGVGYSGVPDFYLQFCSDNEITNEGPAWHEFWTGDTYVSLSQLQAWVDNIANLQAQYPEANGKYIIWEENNSGGVNAGGPTGSAIDFTRSMANVIRTGVTQNIKGCLEGNNWNGMSDLMTTKKSSVQQNPAVRRPLWWIYYAFSKMSGQYVEVSTDAGYDFTAAACKDTNESKIIIAKSATSGSVNVKLNNQPYSGQDIKIDLYKITPVENDGLQYQGSVSPTPASTDNMEFTINNVGANETWMVVIKKVSAPPSFFHPMTPDDGEIAAATPTLTWSQAQDASSYTVKISENKDLSDPVIVQSGITGTEYSVETPLIVGRKYYWSVTAVNDYGSTAVSNNAVYSFIVGTNTEVPAQFGPYMPSVNAPNESVTTEFKWSTAYNATSYRLVVSKNADMSDPVINQANITSVRSTGQFGPNSQAYYRPTTPLEYDTTYYWTVYAVNENGERPMNGPLHYFSTKAEGDSPTSFSLVSPSDGAVDISARTVLEWEASKNAFFYKLEVSPNADMSDPVILRDRMIYNRYSVEPNVLDPDTTYYWRVTAYTKNLAYSTESSSGVRSFTTEAVPCSPLLYAEHGDNNKVKLWFHTTKGATSYKIKYGTEPGVYTNTITGVTGSPYEITDLAKGTYYFAVVAENESGDSSIWNERSVTLLERRVKKLTIDNSSITLSAGRTIPFAVTAEYVDGYIEDVTDRITYSNPHPDIVKVDNGTITGKSIGTSNVIVSFMDDLGNTLTAQMDINVVEWKLMKLTVDKSTVILNTGRTTPFNVTAEYIDGYLEDVTNRATYSNPHPDIAEVENGVVTAKSNGTTSVTISFEDELGDVMTTQMNINVISAPDRGGDMAWYKFDEAGGALAIDSSGRGNDATIIGATGTRAAGYFGNAVQLASAGNQYVSMPEGIVSELDDFTIALWIRPSTMSTWARIFDIGNDTNTYMFLTLRAGNNNRPRFVIKVNGSSEQTLTAGTGYTLSANNWYHIAITKSGNTARMYLNGELAATNNNMTFNPSDMGVTVNNWIGRSQYSADPYLNGRVDDFSIFSRALSIEEIKALTTESISVEEVKLTTDKHTLKRKEQVQTEVKVKLEGNEELVDVSTLEGAIVDYFSFNPGIASIDENGVITAEAIGETEIEAAVTYNDETIKSEPITITVEPLEMDAIPVKLEYPRDVIDVGEQMDVTIKVENAQELYAANFKVEYDPELFEIEDVEIDETIGISGEDVSLIYTDDKDGLLNIIFTLLGVREPINGEANILNIKLKAKDEDSASSIKIQKESALGNIHGEMTELADEVIGRIVIADADVTGSGIAINDLVLVARAFGKMEDEEGYEARLDMNKDGIIDIIDIAYVASKVLNR